MNRRTSLLLLLLALVSSWTLSAATPARPNVLLLMSDDLAATLGCYDHPVAKTPHLDALAKRGVQFDRAYCHSPTAIPPVPP